MTQTRDPFVGCWRLLVMKPGMIRTSQQFEILKPVVGLVLVPVMHNVPARNWAIRLLPNMPMFKNRAAINPQLAVAVHVDSICGGRSGVHACSRTVRAATGLELCRNPKKRNPTLHTSASNDGIAGAPAHSSARCRAISSGFRSYGKHKERLRTLGTYDTDTAVGILTGHRALQSLAVVPGAVDAALRRSVALNCTTGKAR